MCIRDSFNAMLAAIARLDASDQHQAALGNLLYTLFAVEQATFDAAEVIARDARLARLFGRATGRPAVRPAVRARAPRASKSRLAA